MASMGSPQVPPDMAGLSKIVPEISQKENSRLKKPGFSENRSGSCNALSGATKILYVPAPSNSISSLIIVFSAHHAIFCALTAINRFDHIALNRISTSFVCAQTDAGNRVGGVTKDLDMNRRVNLCDQGFRFLGKSGFPGRNLDHAS